MTIKAEINWVDVIILSLVKIKHLTRELNYIDLFLLVISGVLRYNPNVPPWPRRPDQRDRLECRLLVIVVIQYTILWLRAPECEAWVTLL